MPTILNLADIDICIIEKEYRISFAVVINIEEKMPSLPKLWLSVSWSEQNENVSLNSI